MTASLPARADAVVIGGGIVGCSVAYHLTKRGCADVVLDGACLRGPDLRARCSGDRRVLAAGQHPERARRCPLSWDAVINPVDTTMALALTPAEVSLRAFFDPHGERVYG